MISNRRRGRGRFGRRNMFSPTGLWKNADFVRFWLADTLSWVGSQINVLTLPLIAVLTLDVSPFQVGALAAAGQAPLFLIGLFAGAWVERRKRRPILITADLARAVLLLAIPIAAVFDALSMPLLYAVAFSVGIFSVFFDVSYLSYLPALVGRDRLVEANSKLEASASGAQVVGPFLGGVLVGVLTAPFAILIDALSYLASAVMLRRITSEEARPARSAPHTSLWRQIGDGLKVVGREPTLRALAGCSAVTNLFGWVFLSVYIIFMERELGLGATAIGLVFASGGVGALKIGRASCRERV